MESLRFDGFRGVQAHQTEICEAVSREPDTGSAQWIRWRDTPVAWRPASPQGELSGRIGSTAHGRSRLWAASAKMIERPPSQFQRVDLPTIVTAHFWSHGQQRQPVWLADRSGVRCRLGDIC